MKIVDILFPKQCIVCGIYGDYLCKSCKTKLKPHPEICPYCHKYSQDYKICIDCRMKRTNYLEGIIIPFVYSDILKKLVLKLKYAHKRYLSHFLAQRLLIAFLANPSLQSHILPNPCFVTAVPSHWRRKYFIKGYNQSELLAKNFCDLNNLTYVKLAKKRRNTKSQAKLNRKQRLKNLDNAFHIYKNLPIPPQSIILIIDDITTSGATLNELAKSIKQIYPHNKIRALVL
ncbi:MAG: ComF family protein [bacterium]|nr:ComF family protein [bacterium]